MAGQIGCWPSKLSCELFKLFVTENLRVIHSAQWNIFLQNNLALILLSDVSKNILLFKTEFMFWLYNWCHTKNNNFIRFQNVLCGEVLIFQANILSFISQ